MPDSDISDPRPVANYCRYSDCGGGSLPQTVVSVNLSMLLRRSHT